jgi:hypothetical protein
MTTARSIIQAAQAPPGQTPDSESAKQYIEARLQFRRVDIANRAGRGGNEADYVATLAHFTRRSTFAYIPAYGPVRDVLVFILIQE